MESRPKSNTVKQKASNRKFFNKSENFISPNKKGKLNKYILKTRGLYVVRNPEELKVDKHDSQQANEKDSLQKHSYRKFSSITRTIGNRKEENKTKKRNRLRRTIEKEADLEINSIGNKMDLSRNEKIMSRNKKNNIDDGIVYVMPSRGNKNRSLSITDSSMSKRDSFMSKRESLIKKRDSLVSKRDSILNRHHESEIGKRNTSASITNIDNGDALLSESFCTGIDRLATEVLEGWIQRKAKKEKEDTDQTTHVSKHQVDEGLYDLCVDLVETSLNETDSKIYNNKPSTSKHAAKLPKRATFENFNYSDADINHGYNVSDEFYITESNDIFETQAKTKKHKAINKNLKSGYLARQKLRRQSKPKEKLKSNYKQMRKNGKKNFLDTIKRELYSCNPSVVEEPRNMFEALKVIAMNKKRTSKHISFEGVVGGRTKNYLGDTDCEFKSPKLLQRVPRRRNRFRAVKKNDIGQLKQWSREDSFAVEEYGMVPDLQVQNYYRTPDKRMHVITT